VLHSAPVTTTVAFLAEAIGTCILAFVIFSTTNKKNAVMQASGMVPPIIGMTVGSLIAVLAPLTQGGFNPGMSFEGFFRHGFLVLAGIVTSLTQPSTRFWTPDCRVFSRLGDCRISGMVDLCLCTTHWGHHRGIGGGSIVCRRRLVRVSLYVCNRIQFTSDASTVISYETVN
jgi:Major intrinsic protein